MRPSIAFLGVVALTITAQAAVPGFIPYSGRLTDGIAPGAAKTLDLRLSVHDAATGGNALFTGCHPSVPVVDGYFTVNLGMCDEECNCDSDPANAKLDAELPVQAWLGIELRSPGETTWKQLTPRQPIGAVPYAVRAENLGGAVFVNQAGQVGVGTSSPGATLDVAGQYRSYYVNRVIIDSTNAGSIPDPGTFYILIHRIYDDNAGELLDPNLVSGTIQAYRGRKDNSLRAHSVNVTSSSAYNGTAVYFESIHNNWKAYALKYNGIKYFALMPSSGSRYKSVLFTGWAIASGGELLKVVKLDDSSISDAVEIQGGNKYINGSLTVAGTLFAGCRRVGGNTVYAPAGTFRCVASASCPSGTVVVGGGADVNSWDMRLAESYPDSDASWTVSAVGTSTNQTCKAYAICCRFGN